MSEQNEDGIPVVDIDETEEVSVEEGTLPPPKPPPPKTPSRRRHGVWDHFEDSQTDTKFAICKHCHKKISKGSAVISEQTNASLKMHMKGKHSEIAVAETMQSPAGTPSRKRGPSTSIFNMCTKKCRTELFQSTIPGHVEAMTKLKFTSEKAQRLTKSIFEMLVVDLLPWHTVGKPGFLRHQVIATPNYIVPGEKYFRGMLEPTFERVKCALQEKLAEHDPPVVSAVLDGWTAHHFGYIGINLHYIHEWERVKFMLRCAPFKESHTAEHINDLLETSLADWGLITMTTTCLRDNAPNMVACFSPTISCLTSAGCLNHSLQLVIKHTIFVKPSVENLIKKCHSLASFANQSTKFYTELYKQQEKQLNCTEKWSIRTDVDTR